MTARDRTRRKIAEAAREVFLDVGYENAVVDVIAAHAGVSRATFYVHFANKMDVLAEIWTHHLDLEVLRVIRDLDALGPYPERERLHDWIDEIVAYWQSTAVINELSERVLALDPQVTRVWVDRNQRAVDALPNYLSRFRPEQIPAARARMGMLLLQLDRMCFVLNRGELPYSREVLIDALTDLWWGCMRPGVEDE